jgi:thiamine-phosphate pyrophosphorylase
MKRAVSGLYAVTPDGLHPDVGTDMQMLCTQATQVLAGGASVLQYRNKRADPAARSLTAQMLARLCAQHDALFVVNDDVELARTVGAHGVHLGRDDVSVRAAREQLGPAAIIGASCYNDLERAAEAAAAGADYLAFGSMFPSRSKPAAVRAPLELLGVARARFGLPVVAIGGLTLDNASLAIEAGADAIAVITALFQAADPRCAAREFTRLFNRSQAPLTEPR